MTMARILVVEDEESYRESLLYQLSREGFDVVAVSDGLAALDSFDTGTIDLVLLDLMLPGLSGVEVCRKIRAKSDVPVIMLTAKDSEIDKIVGLELGADDYVTKPYSFRELLARIRAVLRRVPTATADSSQADADNDDEEIITAGPVTMNLDRHTVHIGGVETSFPLKEFEVLEYLLRNAGRVLTRGQLIDRVWGLDYVGDTKTLDVHIKRIRAKIEPDPSQPTYILTVRGLGYRFTEPAEQ